MHVCPHLLEVDLAAPHVPRRLATAARGDDDRVHVLPHVLEDARHGRGRDVRVAAAEVEPPLQRPAPPRRVARGQVDAVVLERPLLALLLGDALGGGEQPVVVARAGDIALVGSAEELSDIDAVEERVDRVRVEGERLLLVPPVARRLVPAEGDVREVRAQPEVLEERLSIRVRDAGRRRHAEVGRQPPQGVPRDARLEGVHVVGRVRRHRARRQAGDAAAAQICDPAAAGREEQGVVRALAVDAAPERDRMSGAARPRVEQNEEGGLRRSGEPGSGRKAHRAPSILRRARALTTRPRGAP